MPFFEEGPARDPSYLKLRDEAGELIADGRAFVESLWEECHPYLDNDLVQKAKAAYHPAFWELYVAHTLRRHGVDLVRRSDRQPAVDGPDLLASDPRVWVEAVAPGPGDGPDAVPRAPPGVVSTVPDDQIILRYRSVIRDKAQQIQRHHDRRWIRDDDPVVVAINGGLIPSAWLELTIPRIVRAVFPIGHERYHVGTESMEVVDHSFEYRAFVKKRQGAEVPVDYFTHEESAGVSAVLASCVDEINRPEVAGVGIILVHNPLARVPLPRGWLPCGWEYWVDQEQLHREEHSLRVE